MIRWHNFLLVSKARSLQQPQDGSEVSPLLGSRSGLSTAEDSMADIAAKIAELVDV